MTSPELENLVRTSQLKREPPSETEIQGLVKSGEVRLADATNTDLSLESRFDLAYNAGHALAHAALRRLGYRSENRFAVFQALPHSLGVPPETWRMLNKCHTMRNQAEYEGFADIDARLVTDLVAAVTAVRDALRSAMNA